ncbi:hypothetical protein LWP59_26970 [Amycolatopsis acidiphila]|uniref:hypothetical protein n=1 Tax=Amycolatopsis acidiphila TaxID=715473 RepID=UPI001643C135|nr:hypothetical protein [Amycolatopsis acidiphila]UIJ57770.1 hypothetical protein LWP59_26970 [Amycolatopsis acidiphila]
MVPGGLGANDVAVDVPQLHVDLVSAREVNGPGSVVRQSQLDDELSERAGFVDAPDS